MQEFDLLTEKPVFEAGYRLTDHFKINYAAHNNEHCAFSWNKEQNCYVLHDVDAAWQMWKAARSAATTPVKEDWQHLYLYALKNTKPKHEQNWVHIARLGVGSGRARNICSLLGINPESTAFEQDGET